MKQSTKRFVMNKIICYCGLLLCFCAGCSHKYDASALARLTSWDNLIWERAYTPNDSLPNILLDSLATISTQKLSKETEAYYNLLLTIVRNKANVPFSNDSLIARATDTYRDATTSRYNYVRSLFYQGAVRYEINTRDSTVYKLAKKAEEVYDNNHLADDKLLSMIYNQLGNACHNHDLFEEGVNYYKKALVLFEDRGELYNIATIKCNLIYSYISLQKTQEVWDLIQTFPEMYRLTFARKLTDCLSMYYKLMGDIEKSIYYKKVHATKYGGTAGIPYLYSLANSYYRMENKDSSLVYLNALFDSLQHSNNPNKWRYYQVASDMYFDYALFQRSKMCTDSAFAAINDNQQQAILEVEKKYDMFQKDTQIKEARQRSTLFFILSGTLLLALLFVISFFTQYRKNRRTEIQLNQAEVSNLEMEKRNLELTTKILLITCKTVPTVISSMGALVKQNTLSSKEEYNQYVQARKSIEKTYRDQLMTFLADEIVGGNNHLILSDGLTTQECIINHLCQEHFSNDEIALFFNTTPDAIRVARYRINAKKQSSAASSDAPKANKQ